MLDRSRIPDLLDDFLHGLLPDADAAEVQAWLDTDPEGPDLLAVAERRRKALAQLPPVEASEQLIRRTLERIEMKATRPRTWLRTVSRTFLALAATALVAIGMTHAYYYALRPSPYSLQLVGQNRLLADSEALLRLAVIDRQSGAPVAKVPVEVAMLDPRSRKRITLASFQSTADRLQVSRVALPDLPPGEYQLEITAQTPDGTERLAESIELVRSFKLHLSTDKPLYQPGQVIHLRSLALRRPDLKPVAGDEVLFQIADSKGNVIFKRRDTTSKFGIASADCQLAHEINEGQYQIECRVGDTTSRRTVKVEKYTLPKFKVNLEVDKPFYQPGETVSVNLSADYFFGQPVAGAEVKLEARSTDVIERPFWQNKVTTDASGKAALTLELPATMFGSTQHGGNAKFQLYATVTDSAGQSYTALASRLVTSQPIQLEIIPENGRLVRGQANRIYVHASYADGRPAQATLQVNDRPEKLETSELGVASFEVTPDQEVMAVMVVATDAERRTGRKAITLATGQAADDFVLRTDKAVYDGGDTMELSALGGGVEPVFVDVVKDGQAILSDTIDMQQGRGTLVIDLPPELFGSVQLVAYRFGQSGLSVRKSRLIYIEQARELTISATLDQEVYRPGDTARLRFALTDGEGKPRPGAISLAAVDEAVYAVLQQRPGLEQAFFLAEQELLQPVYTIYPAWSPDRLLPVDEEPRRELELAVFSLAAYTAENEINIEKGFRGGRPLPGSSTVAQREEPAADAPAPRRVNPVFQPVPLTLVANSFPAKAKMIEQRRQSGLDLVAVLWFAWISVVVVGGVLLFAVAMPRAFMWTAGVLFVVSLLCLPLALIGVTVFDASHFVLSAKDVPAGGEVMAEMAMPASPAAPPVGLAETSAPPRVRRHFPETLLWQPELVTDDQGRAELEIPLADSITTWRLSATAVSGAGELGDVQLPVKVFQPFFVDLNLPVALTRHDEVSVPVVVYNYRDEPQTVALELKTADWFELLDEKADATRQTLELGAGEIRSVYYRLRVLQVGRHPLQVTAQGGGVADAIERSIEVLPNGVKQELVQSGTLGAAGEPVVIDVTIPEEVIPGSVAAFVKFHPTGFSQLVEGLDAIFRMPSGCFEQTSSTTYPNVLALDYLRARRSNLPHVEAKARQYIHLGYQRLLGFEVPGGGFDWYGNPPGKRALTAYGLMEFVDMARVHDVDPALIERTRSWLLRQRRADGTWEADPHKVPIPSADPTLATTAYIAWSVFHSAPHATRPPELHAQFAPTVNYLLAQSPDQIDDPYLLAAIAMALAAYDPEHPQIDPYLARLVSLKREEGKLCWWEQPDDASRPLYGSGNAGRVQTTAMATLALLSAGQHRGVTDRSLAWLVAQKDPHGTWHSTQATILALKALLLGTGSSQPMERRFEIAVDDQAVETLVVSADQADVMQQIDLAPWLTRAGMPQQIRITEQTETQTAFQVVVRHYVEPADETEPAPEPLAITIDYDRDRLPVDETVTATCTVVNQMEQMAPMVILDLPIPGGFVIEAGELDELVGSRLIEKYEITPRQAIIYLRELPPQQKLELRYRLRAVMPVKVTVPPGVAYEYYDPAKRGESDIEQLQAE